MENIETIPSPTMMSSLGKLGKPHQPHPPKYLVNTEHNPHWGNPMPGPDPGLNTNTLGLVHWTKTCHLQVLRLQPYPFRLVRGTLAMT